MLPGEDLPGGIFLLTASAGKETRRREPLLSLPRRLSPELHARHVGGSYQKHPLNMPAWLSGEASVRYKSRKSVCTSFTSGDVQ